MDHLEEALDYIRLNQHLMSDEDIIRSIREAASIDEQQQAQDRREVDEAADRAEAATQAWVQQYHDGQREVA